MILPGCIALGLLAPTFPCGWPIPPQSTLVETPRERPAVYFVDALGATANDPSDDDTPGIQAAIDAAIAHATASGKDATVLLRGGSEYRLKSGKRGLGHLDLSCAPGTGRVLFAGQGATLIVETPRLGIFFAEGADAITIKDVVLDLDPLPHVAGRVSEVDALARRVVVIPLPGASSLDRFPGYSEEWGWLHDGDVLSRPKRGAAGSFRASKRSQQRPGGKIDFTMDAGVRMSDFQVGDVLSFHYRRGNNFRFQNCSDVELRGVVSFGAGLFFVSTSHVDGLRIADCAVLLRPGRVQATGGDGIHLKYDRRVRIQDSYFEGLSDDGVNISATFDFRIERCEFRDKRRHAMVLDTDRVAYRSREGVIAGNVVEFNGGSALLHDGGAYSSVIVSGTRARENNLSVGGARAVEGNLRLRAAVDHAPGEALPGLSELAWDADGRVLLAGKTAAVGGRSQRLWRQLSVATPRGLRWRLEALVAGGPQPWLYLTAGESLTVERSVLLGTRPDPRDRTIDAQLWIREPAGGGAFRWKSELTGQYISRGDASSTGLSLAQDPGAALAWTLTRR